jgi:hypothetical protein
MTGLGVHGSDRIIDDSYLMIEVPIDRLDIDKCSLNFALELLFEIANDRNERASSEAGQPAPKKLKYRSLFKNEKGREVVTFQSYNTTLQEGIESVCAQAGITYRMDTKNHYLVIFEDKKAK